MNKIIENFDPDFSVDYVEVKLPQPQFVMVTESGILEADSEAELGILYEQYLWEHNFRYSILE